MLCIMALTRLALHLMQFHLGVLFVWDCQSAVQKSIGCVLDSKASMLIFNNSLGLCKLTASLVATVLQLNVLWSMKLVVF